MTLTEFIEGHDRAILAIERLRNLLKDEVVEGVLEHITDIESHLKLAEFEYLNWMQYLTEEG